MQSQIDTPILLNNYWMPSKKKNTDKEDHLAQLYAT